MFNFKKIQASDISGKKGEHKLHEAIGNALYCFGPANVGNLTLAQAIFRGEAVDISASEIKDIQRVITDPRVEMYAFAQVSINDYIKKIQEKNCGLD